MCESVKKWNKRNVFDWVRVIILTSSIDLDIKCMHLYKYAYEKSLKCIKYSVNTGYLKIFSHICHNGTKYGIQNK